MYATQESQQFLEKSFKNLIYVSTTCVVPLVAIFGITDIRGLCSIVLVLGVISTYLSVKRFGISAGVNILVFVTIIAECYLSVLLDVRTLRFWITGCNICLALFLQRPIVLLLWNIFSDIAVAFMYIVVDTSHPSYNMAEDWDQTKTELLSFIAFNSAMVMMMFMNLKTLTKHMDDLRHLNQELDKAKRAAEALVSMKQDFLSTMSHEMRTPLHGLIGMVRLMERANLPESQCENLDIIEQCGEILLILVNNVLDLSRLEAGLLRLKDGPLKVPHVLKRVLGVLKGLAKQKGTMLLGVVDKVVPESVLGDEERWTQIVLNIAANAVKYTEFGTIRVIVRVVDHNDAKTVKNSHNLVKYFCKAEDMETDNPAAKTAVVSPPISLARSISQKSLSNLSSPIPTSMPRSTLATLNTPSGSYLPPLTFSDPSTQQPTQSPCYAPPSSPQYTPTSSPKLTAKSKATQATIYMETPPQQQYLLFLVEDTGLGISKEAQKRIFDPFEQGDNPHGGSGLGLTICKRLVSLMGGEIGVHSELGKGSVFWFYVPLVVMTNTPTSDDDGSVKAKNAGIDSMLSHASAVCGSPVTQPPTPQQATSPPAPVTTIKTKTKTITKTSSKTTTIAEHVTTNGAKILRMLLVDDNITNLRVLLRSLEKFGYTNNDVATNGQKALDVFGQNTVIQEEEVSESEGETVRTVRKVVKQEGNYDVIFMDVQMPIMGGLECAFHIRKIEEKNGWKKCVIIGLSADASMEIREKAEAHGIDYFLTKPFVMDDVLTLLNMVNTN